jgi:hypothetical protein
VPEINMIDSSKKQEKINPFIKQKVDVSGANDSFLSEDER